MVIGIGGESAQHYQCVHNATVRHLSDRDTDIEESDERLASVNSESCSSNCVAVTRHGCVLDWDYSFGKCWTHRFSELRGIGNQESGIRSADLAMGQGDSY